MIQLDYKLKVTKEETSKDLAHLRAEKTAEIDSLKNTLAFRKERIAYFDKFNEVEKHVIKAEIE